MSPARRTRRYQVRTTDGEFVQVWEDAASARQHADDANRQAEAAGDPTRYETAPYDEPAE